jgi:CheY-like chemotaxis protein
MTRDIPLKIMIADDDCDDRELLNFLISKNPNFEIIGCVNQGTDVIEEIITKGNVPDILLIDLYMPKLSGSEVVQKILDSNVAPKLDMFIISGNINLMEKDKHKDSAAVRFIKKPVSLVEINDLPGVILEALNCTNNTKI